MHWFRTTWFRFWMAPLVIAAVVFSVVQPGFAAALEVESTLASYLAAGNSLTSYGLVSRDGDLFSQVFYEYQGNQYIVTDDNRWKRVVESEGEYIVWQAETTDGWQIFLHNIPSGETVQVSSGLNNIQPRLDASGPYVVWRGWTDDDWQIFLHDGVSTRQVTQGDVSWNAEIENGVIVFNRQDDAGGRRAVRYDISTKTMGVLKEGRLAMHPYFNDDGTIGYHTQNDHDRVQALLASQTASGSGDGDLAVDEGLAVDHTLSEALNYYGITECPPEPRPVCGADGVTYINACVAFWSETTLKSSGVCEGKFINPTDPFSSNHPLYEVPAQVAVNDGGGGGAVDDNETETGETASDSGAFDPGEAASTSDDFEGGGTASASDTFVEGGDASITEEFDDSETASASDDVEEDGGFLGFIGDLFTGDDASPSDEGAVEEETDETTTDDDIEAQDPVEPETVTEEDVVEEMEGVPLADDEEEGVETQEGGIESSTSEEASIDTATETETDAAIEEEAAPAPEEETTEPTEEDETSNTTQDEPATVEENETTPEGVE